MEYHRVGHYACFSDSIQEPSLAGVVLELAVHLYIQLYSSKKFLYSHVHNYGWELGHRVARFLGNWVSDSVKFYVGQYEKNGQFSRHATEFCPPMLSADERRGRLQKTEWAKKRTEPLYIFPNI